MDIQTVRIVADSSADLLQLKTVPFYAAPMKVITAEKEYIDNENLDIATMVEELRQYKGRSSSSCPNPEEWLRAFGDAQYVFAVTITSGLSGSYNAALSAKGIYESDHPGRQVFLVDSLSAGPGLTILVEKLEQLVLQGLDFEAVCQQITAYQKRTGLLFMLESLKNFANNGRVSPAVAKITGILGIRIVGKASPEGTLEPTDKCRSQAKSIQAILDHLMAFGFQGGRVCIAHCYNAPGAQALKDQLLAQYPSARVTIHPTRGLCSFYAEKGGLLVGYDLD